jgi:steroid 5-alpha reductase family enzyme
MTLMFYFISIPMIDKRMTVKKTGYKNYKSTTPGLIPWFPKAEKPK